MTVRSLDKRTPIPKTGQVDYWDESLSAFGLRVSYGGKKTWLVRYRHGSRRKRMKIGNYTDMGLADARDAAKDALRAASKGEDPGAKVRIDRTAESFAVMADDYVERYARRNKKSWQRDQQIIKRDLKPAFQGLKAKEVRRADVNALLDRIVGRGAPILANRTFEVLRGMYRWAISQDIVEASPCYGLKKPSIERRRERVLNHEEIQKVWGRLPKTNGDKEIEGMANMSPFTAYALKLTLATCQRPGDVAAASRPEINRKERIWTIPGERYKSGRAQLVPLSDFVLTLLDEVDEIDELASKGPYFFPSPRGQEPRPITEIALSQAVRKNLNKFEVENWKPHDLRRSAATHIVGERIGATRFMLARILGHADKGVTGIYDLHAYVGERRAILDAWGRLLSEIVTGKSAESENVVTLKHV